MSVISVSEFSSLNFRTDWKLPFQQNVDYIPKFLPSDLLQVQYITFDKTVKTYLRNNNTGLVTELQCLILEEDEDYQCCQLSIDNSGVTEEMCFTLFFARSAEGDILLEGDFIVCTELPGTILLKYTNRRDDKGTIFYGVDPFLFRVEGAFLPSEVSFENDSKDFRDQRYVPEMLSDNVFEKQTLTLGGGFGVPNWVARKINLIFSLSYVFVDGNRMVRSEGSTVEITLIHNDYPLFLYKLVLERGSDISGESATIEFPRVADEKKKIIRQSSDSEFRVYSVAGPDPSQARMIRELEFITELSENYTIEIDDNTSSTSNKVSLNSIIKLFSDHFLSNKNNDIAKGVITFLKGINIGNTDDNYFIDGKGNVNLSNAVFSNFQTNNFLAGPLGAGTGTVNKNEFQTDNLMVRKMMIIMEALVQKMRFQGGVYVLSSATGFKISAIEETTDYYRCYFENDNGKIPNEFVIDDQARIQNYTGENQKYLWSLVINKGINYVDLSKSDKDGDGVPATGDELVQLGNRTDESRQMAVMISAANGECGIVTYFNINSFDLSGKEGSWFGRHGGKEGASIRGELHFESGKLVKEAVEEAQTSADNAQSSANEADKKAQAAQESARQAQEAATIANAEIADMSSDSVISPVEKPALKEKWDVILSEKTKIDAQAINIGVSPDAYDNAYNALYNLIGNNLNDLTTKWEIDGPTLRSAFTNYYDARTDLLNTIARVTKEKADKAETDAGNAQKRADDAYKLSDEVNSSVDIILTSIIPDMQEQIDGNIMSWDGEQVPTLSNYPANEWTTEEEKDRHIGDTYDYYLTQDDVKVVKRYKFRKVGENYEWTPLADSDAARLEAELRETLGIANSKNSISYGSRPVPPYSIDDIWITTLKSIYVCRVQRAEGSTGLETDWELVNDTQLRLSNMASDGIISREEKPSYRNTLDQIKKEYATYNASETSVSKTALTSAYNNIVSYMTATLKVTEDSDTDITESQRNQFNVYLAAWYSSVTEFTNLIAKEEAGKAVDNLQVGGTNLLNGTTLDWVDAENAAPNYYVDSVYLPQLRGKQITFSGFIKGIDAQAGSIGLEIDIAYTDGTHGYSQIFFNDRGNFEIHVQKHTLILDKEISNIKAYPIFRTGTVSGTIKVKQIQVEIGNKATDWKPSIHDQDEYAKQQGQQAVDNLQVGSQNLISKKMMLKWNEKRKDIATWGQDDDGIYLNVWPHLLFDNFSISNTIQNPIFNINFKENTQYVFSVEWKTDATEETEKTGLSIRLWYTDGTTSMIKLSNKTLKKTRYDIITPAGKTVEKISSSYGYAIRARIYNISLIEGNKPLNGFPVAEEDQTGSNNVNLAEGTKNVNPAQGNADYRYAQMYMPKIKPNTIYYVNVQNIENVTGTPTEYTFVIYNKNIATKLSSSLNANKNGGVLITNYNFSEQDGYLLCYAGIAGSTTGNTVKFTEIMLVEGFQPAQVWTPSFSEQQNAIDEAQKAADEAQSQIKEVSKTVTKLEANEESIIASVNTVIENVGNNAITAERQAFGQSWNSGKMLYTDPTFKAGVNSIGIYNHNSDGSISLTRIQKQSDSPITDSEYNVEIKNQGSTLSYYGGFSWRHMSRANAIFIYRIIAKIPVGYKIGYARNRAGDYLTEYFATSREGTGKWEEYIYVIRCGTEGVFETIGYFYILGESGTPANPFIWYLAYASVFDMSAGISTADQAKQDAVSISGADATEKANAAKDAANSYTDAKTYKKYVFNLTPDTYDRNTYYPVTMSIPGSPVTTIKLYIDYYNSGNPEWSTHGNKGVAANCIWRSNGSVWGWYTVLRDILDFSYSFSELTPIGGIGQMVNSSNEYVYIRGGAIYYLEITNNVVPVLHTSSFTINNETIILRESVTTPVRTNVARTEYSSKIEELDDKITERVTKTDFSASNQQVQQQIGEIVTKYNSIELSVSDINDTLGTIDIAGMVTNSNFVDIFSSHKSELGETIISSISLTPDSVRIAANKIEISGATIFKDDEGNIVNIFGTGGNVLTINDGVFNVDKHGKLTATDAVIKGTIEATNGKIGGFTIGAINLKNGNLELSQDKIVYNDSNITASFGLNVASTVGSNVTSCLYIKNKYLGTQRACAIFEGTVSGNYVSIGRAVISGLEVMLTVQGQSNLMGNCFFGTNENHTAYFDGQIDCKNLSKSYIRKIPRYDTLIGSGQPNDFGTLGISKSTGRIALIG